ncbi:MAG: LysR substrate-binding domain-containing protein [Candidatus Competibacteraceae bacterium]
MSAQLDPDLLRTFVAIVDAGGFTAAAQQVSHPIRRSMQVRRLETYWIGHCSSARVAACSSRRMAKRCWLCASFIEAARRSPGGAGLAGSVRPVRLGTPDDYVGRFLFDILVRFARAFPRVQVEVHCEPSVNLRRLLAEDRLDLALITCTPGAETGEVLRREPTVWATAERHLAHEDEPLPASAVPGRLSVSRLGAGRSERTGPAVSHRLYQRQHQRRSGGGDRRAGGDGARPQRATGRRPPSRRGGGIPAMPPASITLHRGGSVSAVAERFGPAICAKASRPRRCSSMSTGNPAIRA